jgi:hypothetical protein
VSNLGDKAVGAIRSKLADTQGQVRYAGKDETLAGTVAQAVVTGLKREVRDTEKGQYKAIEGSVRFKTSAEPAAWGKISKDDETGEKVEIPIIGDMVEVLLSPDTSFDDGDPVRARVRNRLVMAGAVRLDVIQEFEEV